jgi:restriction system protein
VLKERPGIPMEFKGTIMDLPKFHETFNPILETLADGKTIHHRELLKLVVEKYYSSLPKELLDERTKSGELLILNRIAWGKSYLKKGGFIVYPERGMVQITEKGRTAAKKPLKLPDIENDENFLQFYAVEKTKATDRNEIKNSSPQDLIDSGFSAIESQIKNELLEKLKDIDPYYFEKVILILLEKMGYGQFIETSKSNDGGIDGIINEDKLGLDKIYIQAKRYNENKVREKDIRNFIGAMSGDTTKGVFVTTSVFDESAIKKAHDAHHKIILIDGIKLVELMYSYGVGVQVKNVYEVKQVDEDFFEAT